MSAKLIVTPALVARMFEQLDMRFMKGVDAAKPWSSPIVEEVPSSSAFNLYPLLDKLPRFREWFGPRQVVNERTRDYTLKNRSFELTVEVDRDDMEDDQMGLHGNYAEKIGEQAAKLPDDLVEEALTANGVCFDGQPFFDTAHPISGEPGASTYSNDRNLALNADNYGTLRAEMAARLGSDGRAMGILPNLLIVPPQLEGVALEILQMDRVSDGAGAGVSNKWKGTAELIVVPQLAANDNLWYLAATNYGIKPIIVQKRRAPEFVSQQDLSSDIVFNLKKFRFGSDARMAAGYSLPFLMTRSEG